jgi:hypothetical protein
MPTHASLGDPRLRPLLVCHHPSPPSRVIVATRRTLGAANKPLHALALSTHAEPGTLGAVQDERFRAMREKLFAEEGAT